MRAGLNYVDTSPFYGEGKSEEVLGRRTMMVMILMETKEVAINHLCFYRQCLEEDSSSHLLYWDKG